MLKTIILAGLVGFCVSVICRNGTQLAKVGCMKRNSKVFTDMLANNRNDKSSAFIGKMIDWNEYESSIQLLACACALKAKQGNYIAIALGNYGECFGTKDRTAYEKWMKSPTSISSSCISQTYGRCVESSTHCIGRAYTEHVYSFPSKAPKVINGGYSKWAPYSECSATCGEGFKERERACNNPPPANGGADCAVLGEATETSKCNLKACPVNGGYSSWSTYGSCSKSCGGGQQSRIRKCNNPTPTNGGSQCSGVASESKNCNTQPCLASAICSKHDSTFKTYDGGNAIVLDRHTLNCPAGKVMNQLKLTRNKGGKKIRYDFKCCKSQLPCSDQRKTNRQTYNGGKGGNTVYLDRQPIACGQRGLSYLKLDRSGDKWNYKYDCCKVDYTKVSMSCNTKETKYENDGKGHNAYLDRHDLKCPSNQFISYMHLIRKSDKIAYRYNCCKINLPAPTN